MIRRSPATRPAYAALLGAICFVIVSQVGERIGGSAIAANRANHICKYVAGQCQNTGDARCDAYMDENGVAACGDTDCWYCDSSNNISSWVCVFLEGSSCDNVGTANCGLSVTYIADACTIGTEFCDPANGIICYTCSCDDAIPDPEDWRCIEQVYTDCYDWFPWD